MAKAMVSNSCASWWFATPGQLLCLSSSPKIGDAINFSSLVGCGDSTQSDGRQYEISLSAIVATVKCLNGMACFGYDVGAAFGGYQSGCSLSSLYLTAYNCRGASIVGASGNIDQATVASSNLFWNSVHELPDYAWGVLTASYSTESSVVIVVRDCIFSGNSPSGRSITRRQVNSVAKFAVENCVFFCSICVSRIYEPIFAPSLWPSLGTLLLRVLPRVEAAGNCRGVFDLSERP
jgi:hypothetical protein